MLTHVVTGCGSLDLQVRLLAAALLVTLLEGPAARALLAVAEARAAPRAAVR
jgi:hypothetical protein